MGNVAVLKGLCASTLVFGPVLGTSLARPDNMALFVVCIIHNGILYMYVCISRCILYYTAVYACILYQINKIHRKDM